MDTTKAYVAPHTQRRRLPLHSTLSDQDELSFESSRPKSLHDHHVGGKETPHITASATARR